MERNRRTDALEKESQGGFTLLEVIVAVSILTVGLLAVATMQGSAIIANGSAMDVTDATTLASDQMEKLAALPYDDAALQDTDDDGVSGLDNIEFDGDPLTAADADYGITEQTARGKTYAVYWNVAVDDAAVGTKTVHVIVTWRDHGRLKHLTLQYIRPRLQG
jgi:type IV pilus assembly protein PilV